MSIAFDILTAIGLAIACGLRPFLPALVFGALAAGNVIVNVSGTSASYLESPIWLAIVAVLLVLSLLFHGYGATPTGARVLAFVGALFGGFLFAGAMAQTDAESWLWVGAGVFVAGMTQLAVGDTLRGAAERLGREDRGGLPVYLEVVAGIAAALAVVTYGVITIVYVAFLVRLYLARRRRGDEKYAGLRSLR